MDIKFSCPNCQQPMVSGWESAGLTVPCPSCQQGVSIPLTFHQTPPAALIPCPDCDRSISNLATSCPGCGHPFPENQARLYQQSPQGQNDGCVTVVSGWLGLFIAVIVVMFLLRGCS